MWWLIPLAAIGAVMWADVACHNRRITPQALGALQIAAGAVWALYYAIVAVRAGHRYGALAAVFALAMAGLGLAAAMLAHRRTARLRLEPARGRAESKGDRNEQNRQDQAVLGQGH